MKIIWFSVYAIQLEPKLSTVWWHDWSSPSLALPGLTHLCLHLDEEFLMGKLPADLPDFLIKETAAVCDLKWWFEANASYSHLESKPLRSSLITTKMIVLNETLYKTCLNLIGIAYELDDQAKRFSFQTVAHEMPILTLELWRCS